LTTGIGSGSTKRASDSACSGGRGGAAFAGTGAAAGAGAGGIDRRQAQGAEAATAVRRNLRRSIDIYDYDMKKRAATSRRPPVSSTCSGTEREAQNENMFWMVPAIVSNDPPFWMR
jgi:hypothetical protein